MATAKDVLDRAAVLVKNGETEKAKKFYQVIIDRMPDSEEAKTAKACLDKLNAPPEMNFDDLFEEETLQNDNAPAQGLNASDDWQTSSTAYSSASTEDVSKVKLPKKGKKAKSPKPKKPFYKKWWFWVIIVVVLLIIIASASGGGDSSSSSSSKSSKSSTTTEQSVDNNSSKTDNNSTDSNTTDEAVATMDKYNQIQNDMTYEQVKNIMGFDGTEAGSSSASVAGQSAEAKVYTWKGKALGSNASVSFYNDKVVSKAQAGLE